MKIAFSGSHNCGKTTTVWRVSSQLKMEIPGINLNVVAEQARRCPYPIGSQSNMESQLWMLTEQMKEELHADKYHKLVICDRSVFDVLGYARASKLDELDYLLLKKLAFQWDTCQPYDLIFYAVPMKLCPDDKLREPSLAFQRLAAFFVEDELIASGHYDFVKLTGDYKNRYRIAYDKIMDLIDSKGMI